MKIFLTTVFLISLLSTQLFAQKRKDNIFFCGYGDNHNAKDLCNHLQMNSMVANQDAENAVDKILSPLGLPRNFILVSCPNIKNAVAVTPSDGLRYIVYDLEFMNSIEQSSTNWSSASILAHEIGHHLCGHTLIGATDLADSRKKELEADEFSGFVLFKLGATLSQAQAAIISIGNAGDDTYSTHPTRDRRLNAIEKGFNKAKAQIPVDRDLLVLETDLKREPTSEVAKTATTKRDALYGSIINQGVAQYNSKKYAKALVTYMKAAKMRPQDTTAYVYAVYAAEAKEDYPVAKETYRKLIDLNHKPLAHYKRMIDITQQVEKNNAETLKLVEEARAKFPNDKDLMVSEAGLYISTGRGKEAITKVETAVNAETDPKKKSNLYAVLGTLHDQNKNPDAALAAYKKAVEADPSNFDAQYNLGVYQFNKGAEIYNKTTKMDYATYQKQGAKLEAQAKTIFQQAIPYFEAALKLEPTDRSTMSSLSQIYMKLGRTADAEKMNKQMDALPKKK